MAMIEGAGASLDAGLGYAPLLIVCGFSYLVALTLVQLLVPRIVVAEPGAAHVYAPGH